jgi:hypothetical protein
MSWDSDKKMGAEKSKEGGEDLPIPEPSGSAVHGLRKSVLFIKLPLSG